MKGKVIIISKVCAAMVWFSLPVYGQEVADTFRYLTPEMAIPEVRIFSDPTLLQKRIPGSLSIIQNKELKLMNPLSGNEVFRRSPGVHVVDEEGAGLRTNISIRGLDPDRSRNVLILEDGIPVALNPYGEPEMYYTPAIDRMERVEILKGSGQIMYGPQTIGGVVNYITAEPTLEPLTRIRLRAGMGGFLSSQITHSQTAGNVGIVLNYLNKRADKLGYAGFQIHDLNFKLRYQISQKSILSVKVGVYDELSNSTYIGLTQAMYLTGNQDFTLMAPDDRLHIRRYSLSAVHTHAIRSNLQLRNTAYAYTTTRDWARQDFTMNSSNNNLPSNYTGTTWGDTAVAGSAVFMRNSNGHRNRQFQVMGIESRLVWDHRLFHVDNRMDAGIRIHREVAKEQLLFGKKADAKSGDMIEDETRGGYAFSAFIQNRIDLTKRFSITPGVRFEQFNYSRDIHRRRFNSIVTDTSLLTHDWVTQVIPGFGASFEASENTVIFGGVHRGFAPPRVKDAIDGNGETLNLQAEMSWNTEIGMRSRVKPWLSYELTLFRMDFSNQIIPVSQSSGGAGAGLINAGRTLHQGIELAGNMDFGKWLNKNYSLELQLQATFLEARFVGDRYLMNNGESVNISGNKTPYAPSVLAGAGLCFEMKNGWAARAMVQHVGKQFTDLLNSAAPSADGRSGLIEAYTLIDAGVFYQVNKKLGLNLTAKNLLSERYVVSRRPQGIRMGLPLFVMAGVDLKF